MGSRENSSCAGGTVEDDTLPGGPYETTIEYIAPFFKPDREANYRKAWAFPMQQD